MFRGSAHLRSTPQTEQAHILQVPNNGGGFCFTVTPWQQLHRFLILGSAGGTYYVNEGKLTREAAQCLDVCLAEDPARVVREIVAVSEAGRAPKQDPAIFALALCAASKNETAAKDALAAMPRVCRTGTHLFQFIAEVKGLRGFGPALRKAIGRWYTEKTPDQMAYQCLKYAQREGWSHRDIFRLAHVDFFGSAHEALARYIVAGADGLGARSFTRKQGGGAAYEAVDASKLPRIIEGKRLISEAGVSEAKAATLITEYKLPRELVPTELLKSPDVWLALLQDMPLEAMLRNLGKMTSIGLVAPLRGATTTVVERLTDADRVRKARLHPLKVLVALRTYQQGRGDKGSLTWQPVPSIVGALNDAFYLGFQAIEPTDKNHLLGIDVSGSMAGANIAGLSNMSAREASAAMAMVAVRTEANTHTMAFSGGFIPLNLHARMSLEDVLRVTDGLPFQHTDCSLPMVWALRQNVPVDVFVIYTDSETNANAVHPHVALESYRQKMGRPAKLVVCALTATNVSIANPEDGGMLDVVGFDTAAPAVIADFVRA